MPTRVQVSRPADFIAFPRHAIQQGIHQRIEEQARLYGDHCALKSPEGAVSYAELNAGANSLAADILAAAGTKLAQAAILLPHSPDCIASILASLKAHKAYVPLDPRLPKERLHSILDDVEPAVLVTDEAHLAFAEELCGRGIPIVNLSRVKTAAGAPNPNVACDPMDRAYILYTSGSTGKPKGITFLHRNLMHHIGCMTDQLFFAPSDRVTWLHSASFSASVVDIYSCLLNGGTLYPWDAKARGFIGMAEWFASERVTTLQWIPSAFRQFLRTVLEDFVFGDVRIVVMASEPLTSREVVLFRRHFREGSHLVNQVGTSESYNYRLYAVDHRMAIKGANVPAGYAASEEREVVILGADLQPAPPGKAGEIGIKSDYMSAGYWRNEALTESKFVRIGGDPTPVYLTGDMGRLEPDGCLIHLGRKDSQVKLRGYRIELAEIDHALMGCAQVADSLTQVAKDRRGEDQLVSYLVLSPGARFSQADIERHLSKQLPEYMVPRNYVPMSSFPALPNGKIDMKQFPNPFEPAALRAVPVEAKARSLRREVVKIFAELLEHDRVREDSNFLQEGGDSLQTAVLMHLVHRRFGVEIEMERFLQEPTPAGLAVLVKAALEGRHGPRSQGRPLLAAQPSAEAERPAAPQLRIIDSPVRQIAVEKIERHGAGGSPALKRLVIIGAGGLGRETFGWATQCIAAGAPWRIKGFLDERTDALRGWNYSARILGDIESYAIEEGDVFIGAVGDPRMKVKCYAPILKRGGRFVNVIHPLANIGQNVELGVGIVAGPFSSITCDARVGDHVSFGALSNLGHDTRVGDWCHISSHCGVNGGAVLGEGAFLGSHACIVPRIGVGSWAYVGAGSVVVREVPTCTKVFGDPAVAIGKTQEMRFEALAAAAQ